MRMTKKKVREQLELLAHGASGSYGLQFDKDEDEFDPTLLDQMGLEDWLRWVGAVKKTFSDHVFDFSFDLFNLHEFERIDQAVHHLWQSRKSP